MAAYHCCVPKCTNDSRYDSLSTASQEIRTEGKCWLIKIRRDEGAHFKVKAHTKVCSAHFKPSDFAKTLTGLKCLTKDAFPSLFERTVETPSRNAPTPSMNNPKRKKLDINESDEEIEVESTVETPQPEFHDYMGRERQLSAEEKLEGASKHIDYLKNLVEKITIERFCLHRFSSDPKLMLFYTGFSSYSLVMNVFNLLRPTAEKMTRWSQLQRNRAGQAATINTDLSFRCETLPLVD